MQGSSMLTVKQVANALGIDERSVRDKLTLGTLKGSKKTVGQRDQWFVHQRDLDAELARRGQSPINQMPQVAEQSSMPPEAATPPVVPTFLYQPESAPAQGYFAPPQQPATANQYSFSQTPQPPEVHVPPVMTSHFQTGQMPASATSAAAMPSPEHSQTATMEQQSYEDITDATVLENLVDGCIFENESAEAPTSEPTARSWRNEDLEGQVTAAAEKILKPLMDRVQDLTKEIVLKDLQIEEMDKQLKLLPDFEAQKAKFLRDIEAERKGAEIQFNKAKEREEEAKALEVENALLKQKAEEALLSAAKLADLEKVVLELQKPKPTFWQKVFGTSSKS